MLANNNSKIISRMAKRSLKSNKNRTAIMITAVMLSAVMLFSVLTVGITYYKMQRVQNIRMSGADFDAIMYGFTDEQKRVCEEEENILTTGIIGISGWVKETEQDKTPNVGLIWADETYWNEMMKPARKWMKGTYPGKENEVMATKKALKECGMEHLEVGDSIALTYEDRMGEHTETFLISGMWEGYGDKSAFYVSEQFYQKSGNKLSEVSSGRCHIKFNKNMMTQGEQAAFINKMHLEKQQRLFFMDSFSYSTKLFAGMAAIIAVTCLCAYLLIYNILYLSVSGNVRYYGLLQTVGMTRKQIKQFLKRQMLFVGGIGIVGGILLGSGVSFVLIPGVVKTLGVHMDKVTVTFHPVVFLITILLTSLTVYAGSRKSVKMAASISPIAALGYRPGNGKKSTRHTGTGKVSWRMAKEQITKDKKKSAIVILSLAVSMSVFLCLITLMESQGARTIISNYLDADITITNDTLKKEEQKDWRQILNSDFVNQIEQTEGVKEVHSLLSTLITVPWEPEFSDIWMREFYEMWMDISYDSQIEEYKAYPENFGSVMIGIDETVFGHLNEELETPIDKEAFLKGETCILYRNELAFETKDLKGKSVTCNSYSDQENSRTFRIEALTDNREYAGELRGFPPIIIVSDRTIKNFAEQPYVSNISVLYQEEYDKETENNILAAMETSTDAKDFSYTSKIEAMEKVKDAQGNMMEVGMGIVLILALIGILNYVNTVMGNIQNRQVELAVLESLGMTERQINRMVVTEGIIIAGSSLVVTAVAGGGVTYWIYQSMNYRGIAFSVPMLPIAGMIACVFAVCIIIPLVIKNALSRRGTVVERIRGFE